MSPTSFIRPTVARIDLGALADNVRLIRRTIGPKVGIIAVIKADAYGHGAAPVARLLEGTGVRGFGVATVEEAVALRGAGIGCQIFIMGAAFGRDHAEVIHHELAPLVGDAGDIEHFAGAARAAGRVRFSIHVKIDTGMHRLGVPVEHFSDFLRRSAGHPSLRVDGLATHFAFADGQDPAFTEQQLRTFIACLDQARAMGADPQVIHAANTAAALRFPQTRFDLVRPGLALYGALPSAHVTDPGLTPVMSLHSRVIALRTARDGDQVCYGSTCRLRRDSVIATLPVGYADGYPRALSGRAQVLIRGARAPVVGAICMDLCMVDVTDIPGAATGDPVTLLGGEGRLAIGPAELAGWAEIMTYELFCGITRRVPRIYIGERGWTDSEKEADR